MIILFVACSVQAYELLGRVRASWQREHPQDVVRSLVKCSALPEVTESRSLTECVGEWFSRTDAIVFLCAAGIAVRCIAPYISHKARDPAVIVMDERGTFCISLLSGHVGGANALAEELAGMTGSTSVITTASDRAGKLAVDMFAARNRLALTDQQAAKLLEGRILAGETIGLLTDVELELSLHGSLPEYLLTGASAEKLRAGIQLSIRKRGAEKRPFELTLQLIPRSVFLGIGCRRGIRAGQVVRAVETCLEEQGICRESLSMAASIDLKKDEPGIREFCDTFLDEPLPFLTFTAEELRRQPGRFTASEFVAGVTGVDNVCERSAIAACRRETGTGRLLCGKFVLDGVTVALAVGRGAVNI